MVTVTDSGPEKNQLTVSQLGGLILIPDGEWIGFDEDRKPLDPFVYRQDFSVEENIVNMGKFSSYAGWLELSGKATRSPKYQLPNVLLKNTGKVRDIAFTECWAPTGWAGKGIPHGGEIGAITRLNMKVCKSSLQVNASHDS